MAKQVTAWLGADGALYDNEQDADAAVAPVSAQTEQPAKRAYHVYLSLYGGACVTVTASSDAEAEEIAEQRWASLMSVEDIIDAIDVDNTATYSKEK